jgi:hypothetical protein
MKRRSVGYPHLISQCNDLVIIRFRPVSGVISADRRSDVCVPDASRHPSHCNSANPERKALRVIVRSVTPSQVHADREPAIRLTVA